MKKIIVEHIIEQAEYFCDKHPDRKCHSHLILSSWYGSIYDMDKVEVHLCDECVENVYKWLKDNFGATPETINF